jgi:hypothetical protein
MENKYIDELGEELHGISMDGFHDDEWGDMDEYGVWQALILSHKAIIQYDEQGFFDYVTYESEGEVEEAWSTMVKRNEASIEEGSE